MPKTPVEFAMKRLDEPAIRIQRTCETPLFKIEEEHHAQLRSAGYNLNRGKTGLALVGFSETKGLFADYLAEHTDETLIDIYYKVNDKIYERAQRPMSVDLLPKLDTEEAYGGLELLAVASDASGALREENEGYTKFLRTLLGGEGDFSEFKPDIRIGHIDHPEADPRIMRFIEGLLAKSVDLRPPCVLPFVEDLQAALEQRGQL